MPCLIDVPFIVAYTGCRVLRIDWGNPKAFQNPPTYDSLVAVAYMIRCLVPELSRLSLQQVLLWLAPGHLLIANFMYADYDATCLVSSTYSMHMHILQQFGHSRQWHHALQVQVAAAKVLTLDASQSFKSVRETLTFAVKHVRAAESAEVSNHVACLLDQGIMMRVSLRLQVRPHMQLTFLPLTAPAGTGRGGICPECTDAKQTQGRC